MTKLKTVYFGWKDRDISREVEVMLSNYFDLCFVRHCAFGETLDQEEIARLKPSFLFSFGPLIVHKVLLDSIQIAAINFHPAPPKWPGRGSCSYALLADDKDFGVTAHLMEEEVDTGRILKVIKFPVFPDDDAEALHHRALGTIPKLAHIVVEELRNNCWHPSPIDDKWERKPLKQKDLFPLMKVDAIDSDAEVRKKIRAFAYSQKPGPYVEFHGLKFWYIKGQ